MILLATFMILLAFLVSSFNVKATSDTITDATGDVKKYDGTSCSAASGHSDIDITGVTRIGQEFNITFAATISYSADTFYELYIISLGYWEVLSQVLNIKLI